AFADRNASLETFRPPSGMSVATAHPRTRPGCGAADRALLASRDDPTLPASLHDAEALLPTPVANRHEAASVQSRQSSGSARARNESEVLGSHRSSGLT